MTENQTTEQPRDGGYAPPPPGPFPPPRPLRSPLRRTAKDRRVLGGVATGIADWLGIDPVLVRVAFVVLAIFGGSGILIYLALWLFLPEAGQPDSAGERFMRDNTALAIVLAVLIAVFVMALGPALVVGGWVDGPGFLGVVLVVAAVAAVVALARRGSGEPPDAPLAPQSPATAYGPTATPGSGAGGGEAATVVIPTGDAPAAPTAAGHQDQPYQASPPPGWPPAAAPVPTQPPPPRPPRDKSVLGLLTVSSALVVVGVLALLWLNGIGGITAAVVVSAVLLVVAVGLLVGTFVGRSRGLIALGVVLVLVLVPLAAIPRGLNSSSGAGERTHRPTTAAELESTYELGAGSMTLDLTELDLAGVSRDVTVSVGAGQIRVWLPALPTTTDVEASVGMGAINLPESIGQGGLGVDRDWSVTPEPGTSAGELTLVLEAGLGEIQVVQPPVVRKATR